MRLGLLLIMAIFLGGCSIPRAAELWLLAESNAPKSPHLIRTDLYIEAAPAESFPSVSISYESKLPAHEVLEAISDQLAAKGWKANGKATQWIRDPKFRDLQQYFSSGDYSIFVDVEGTRESPDGPEMSSGFIRMESRHFWDNLPWIYPRYILWRVFNNKYVAGLL